MHKRIFLPFGILLAATVLSAFILTSNVSHADTEKQADATVTVSSACTMFRDSTTPHVATGLAGNYYQDIGITRLKTICNDKDGYAIYAVGYSNDTEGDTNMYGEANGEIIPTGTESGDVSNWSMKLTKDTNSYNPENLTIISPYNNYAAVPSTQTKVVSFEGATDTEQGSVVETTYAVRVSPTQLADTYTGQVKYTMLHPADGSTPEPTTVYIQDINKENCPTTPTIYPDARDGEEYVVQRLADGECWMMENLRTDLVSLSLEDLQGKTNASNFSLSFLKNGGGNTSDQYPTSGVSIWSNTNSYSDPLIYTTEKNTTGTTGYTDGKYGVYYNFCAASAGSYCFGNGSEPGSPELSPSEDICPKGWMLPRYFDSLQAAYNYSDSELQTAFNVALPGMYYEGQLVSPGIYTYFWTSSMRNSRSMYAMYIYAPNVYYPEPSSRINGASIRCKAKEPEPTPVVTYLQDITPATCPTSPTTVVDSRDGEEYTIQQLADGNCWMLDNLRLDPAGLVTDLSSENTDMTESSTFTLPASSHYFTESYENPVINSEYKNTEMSYGNGTTKVGVFYNICAASAGVVCHSYMQYGNSSVTASSSVCPKGWRLPTGGYNVGEFKKLYDAYSGDYSTFVNALHLAQTSYYSGENLVYIGGNGFWWTNAGQNSEVRYIMDTSSSSASFSHAYYNDHGYSVRCILEQEIEPAEKTYIQDITINNCPTTKTKVYDIRDEEGYYIQKLEDGNCWLLDNLRLDPNTLVTPLTVYNTNMDPNTPFTLTTSMASNMNSSSENYENPGYYNNVKDLYYEIGDGLTGKAGVYYNYCAATAGTYCYPQYEGTGDAMYDICPKGWHMPSGGESGEYNTLATSYDTIDEYRAAFRAALSGGPLDSGTMFQPSNLVEYWTSTSLNPFLISPFITSKSGISYSSSIQRSNGAVVRCVADNAPSSKTYLQDVTTPDSCPTTPTVVYDNRDDEPYVIQMLADGNCWMLENLRLDPETLKTTLTTENTNMSPDVQFTLPASTSSIGNGPTQNTEPQINTDNKNVTASYAGGTGKTGVFYNYCALTAGTICVDENDQDAQYDICPAGWHLPTGGDSGEYKALYDSYSDNNTFLRAIRGVLGGFQTGTSIPTQGQYSVWVSSTHVPSSSSVYGLSFSIADDVYVGNDMSYASRTYGVSVRCVADLNGKYYIQSVNIDNCPTSPRVVYDKRDEEEYTIQKLEDGNCWILENLRLDLTEVPLSSLKGKTNASDSSLEYLKGVRTGTADDKYATEGVANWTEYYSYSAPLMNASRKDSEQSYGEGSAKDGIYYNYCAATAGTYCYGDGRDYGSPVMSPTEDICPSGWRMPTGSVDGEYQSLFSTYNGDSSEVISALRLVKAGYLNSGIVVNLGNSGLFASSTRSGSKYEYNMTLSTSGDIMPQGNNGRYLGTSVRCIAKNKTETPSIQEVTLDKCPSQPTTVYDSRDGNSYTIQRLKDGNCWMLENLNLGKRALTVLTPEDTNITSDFTLPGSTEVGFSSYTIAQINVDSRNDTASYGDGENNTGVYYNFCAATAGTYCNASGTASGDAYQDICPKGWRLPTGGETGEYQNLISRYSKAADFKNSLRTGLYGYFKYSSTGHVGRTGSFWTSTGNDDHIYSLDVRANKVQQDYSSDRNAGISIRCIAKNGTEPKYIQDVTKATCPTTTTTVYDKRDGQAYTIKKIDDDCWMTKNLNLAGGTVLTPELSNVTATYTLPVSTNDSDSFRYNNDEHVYNTNNTDCSGSQPCYSYYTLKAALAGELNPGSPATQDICPAGWQIPDASKANEFRARYVYNLSELPATEWNPERNGYIYSGTSYNTSQFAYYWTSTNSGTSTAYRLRFMYNGTSWNDIAVMGDNNSDGLAVRCIAK